MLVLNWPWPSWLLALAAAASGGGVAQACKPARSLLAALALRGNFD
jgi:hypothetical protein